MADIHPLVADVARLNAIEQQIINRFIHRQRVACDLTAKPVKFGDRVADRVATFGGSSCLAALQAPVIMMSQNRQATHDRVEAEHDYEVNMKAPCLSRPSCPSCPFSTANCSGR